MIVGAVLVLTALVSLSPKSDKISVIGRDYKILFGAYKKYLKPDD